VIRLPLAAALGAVLAWRPLRGGAPRRPPGVETQVVLAVVGAVVMLVIGASLARAFGIVGVAGLVRYRSKINDPKDAVVMLSALSVGLAAGSGLYALAVFSTVFLFVVLWLVEGFERPAREYELSVRRSGGCTALREPIEQVLRRHGAPFEMKSADDDESTYVVTVPNEVGTDRLSRELLALDPDGGCAVRWKKKAKVVA
jgi:uncharacterized membrane protein YhiD involved in acid resistance